MGATLTPDAFMAQQGGAPPPADDLTPDSFMASQNAPPKPQQTADWWDKAKATVEAVPALFTGLTNKATEVANEPLIPESVMPAPAKTPAGAVGRSALEFARGMTSPENIGLAALMGPVSRITPLLSRAVSAGFGVQMLKGAYDQIPAVRDAINAKDWTKAAGAITTAVLSGGLGVAAGTHAVRGGGEAPPSEAPPQTPIEKATESARAGVEALTPDSFMQEQGKAPSAEETAANAPQSETATPPAETMTPDSFMSSNAEVPTLPRDLAGANPRYSYGSKQFDLTFANDLDKAAYITAQEKPSARDADYLKFVMDQTGMSEGDVRNQGRAIRQSIKSQAAGAEPGRLDVDQRLGMAPAQSAPANPADIISPNIAAIAGPAEQAAQTIVGVPATPDAFISEEPQPAPTTGVQPEGVPSVDTAASTPREPSTPPAYGRQANILVPGEQTTYPAQYAVRELTDVAASHNALNFEPNPDYQYTNDRDYSRTGNAARVVQQSAPDTFNPDFLTTESPTAEHGAPIIDASGNVLGGNSRTMTLARVYQRGGPDAEMYRNAIANKAAQFGINPADLDRFQQPVLVREIPGVSRGPWLTPDEIDRTASSMGLPREEVAHAAALPADELMRLARKYNEDYSTAVRNGQSLRQISDADLDTRAGLYGDLSMRAARAINPQRAITDFNKAAAAELTPEERAVSDGRRLSPGTIQDIAGRLGDLGEEGTLARALRGDDGAEVLTRLVNDGMLTPQEAGGYLDDRGNLTPEAKSRIGKALVGRLFDNPAEFRETTPAVRAKLERIAPQLLRVESRPDWSLTDTTRQAIALAEDARVHKIPVEDAAAQSVIGANRNYTPEAIDVAKTLEQGPVKAAGAFRRYANDADLSREGSQGAFFTPPTRMEAFQDAFSVPNVIARVRASERGSAPMLTDLAQLGAHYLRRGVDAFGDWSSKMVEAIGDWVRPYLLRAFAAARKVLAIGDERGSFSNKPLDENSGSLFGSEDEERVAQGSAADRDKLQGERLTAQFNAPVSREEQLRKLRAGQAPAQGNFFEATPEKPQFSLFGDERGAINPDLLSLGAGKFVQEDVIPAAKRVASDLVEAKDDIMRVVAPQTRGSAAEFTGLNLRWRMAQFARRFDQGEARLRTAKRFFNTRTPEQNYDFVDDVEHGLGRGKQGELEPIARMFSRMLDQRRREVQALGEGALKGFYQNYFPHIFEKPEQASKFVESFFGGKRSMEGPKSFLKHRDFPTFREALDAGLKPVSDNPVDLVIMKAREMDRYLLAHAVLRDLADNGIAKRVSGLGPDARQAEMLGGAPIRPEWSVEKREDLPPDFVSIRDPVGGGKWFASEGAADVLNNFLSPGQRGRSGLFRTLLGVNNVMNQANLGLSAFHVRAVSISSMAGRMGLGMVKAMEGHPLDAAFHIFTSPAAPFIDFVKGSKVLHDWFKPGSEGAPIAAMTDALMKGGGRARMDAFYQNAMADKMMTAFRRGNFIGGALRSPFAAIETMSKPLLNYLVPRMKLGAFADMAQHELDKLGPGAKVADVQRAMSAAWDHVENRLGQMTYDNRFWNRTFKDIAMFSVRSVGWNLGDFLEGKSAVGAVKQMATLKKPADLHGLGFAVGYTMTAALMGAMMQYLHTGKGPQELEDYFFPKREDGRRVVSAPYVKDAYQFIHDPARTIENKASPLISTMSQMFHNRDYYDHPIRNVDAPVVKQLQQEAEYVGRQFLPFTLQPYAGNPQKRPTPLPGGNTPEHKVENFLGVTAAPSTLQPVMRNSKGRIARSSAAVRAFREDHPCPSTGSTRGGCPGYVIDHRAALKHGGNDEPANMQWQKISAAMTKDRTE